MNWFFISAVLILFCSVLCASQIHSSSYNVRQIEGKRNLLELEIKGSPVFGNVTELFYYYVDILVGDPNHPSKQSVIIDTGSTVTCFPCKGFCSHCGRHIYPEFDIVHSKSAEQVNCKGKECECGNNNECHFVQAYDEGSSYQGMWVTDYFQFDKVATLNNKTPRYTFGCVTKETNLFYTQDANGIMGLGMAKRKDFKPIFYTLKEDGFIDSLIFSLCFSTNGGKLFMGGYDMNIKSNPGQEIVWAPIVTKDTYSFRLSNVNVGGVMLPIFPTISKVDSGVSLTYMTKEQYNMIDKIISNLCTSSGKYDCQGRKLSTGCYGFRTTKNESLKDFFDSYPSINFVFLDKQMKEQEIIWHPNQYLYDGGNGKYCLAIDPFSNDNSKMIMGASFLINKQTIFDVENLQIGFIDSNCKN